MTVSIILGTISTWFLSVVWPIIVAFAGWIAAGASFVLAFLFSAGVRKYTIAAIAIALLVVIIWFNGYLSGRASIGSADICKNPAFHQIVLTGRNSASTVQAVREHNDLGEQLGCWSNGNIR